MHIVHHNILECALCFVSTAPHAESSYSYSYSYDYLSHSDYQFLATIILVCSSDPITGSLIPAQLNPV